MPYIPKGVITSTIPNERIAIIGPPGSGKTTSLLTFPDLIVLDRDNKLPPGIKSIPAWNPDWADEVIGGKKKRSFTIPNFRDAIVIWLEREHALFEPEQTFAIDSWTFLQDAHDMQTWAEDEHATEKNGFFFWGQKEKFSKRIVDMLKNMRCRVVVTFHEAFETNSKGQRTGKIRPVMSGSYKDQILGGFNFVWRMKGNIPGKNPAGLNAKGGPVRFVWQVAGDSEVDINNGHVLDMIIKKKKLQEIDIIRSETGEMSGGYQTIQNLYKEFLLNNEKDIKQN